MPVFYSRHKVKKSLKLGVLDGASFSAMLGLTQNYITPFAMALKATTAQIGLLASVPNFTMGYHSLPLPIYPRELAAAKASYCPSFLCML